MSTQFISENKFSPYDSARDVQLRCAFSAAIMGKGEDRQRATYKGERWIVRTAFSPDDLTYLSGIDSCTLANAIEPLEVRSRDRGYVGGQIRCMFPDLPRTIGYAVTARVRNRPRQPGDPVGLWELWTLLEAAPSPAILVFESTDDRPDRCAHFGEVMTAFAMKLGAIALVTNGGVRDLDEVASAGFQYFAQFPCVSHGNAEIFDVGSTVVVAGEPISTGDLLHGDQHGILKIPDVEISALRRNVEEVVAAEQRLIAYVKSDEFTLTGARKRGGYADKSD